MEDTRISFYLIPITLVIAGGLIALAIWSQSGGEPQEVSFGEFGEVDVGTLPALGEEGAPVVFVEFGDYQCPFCGKFLRETESRLREDFVSSGKMVMYWRDFAFLGEESFSAAAAARCAGEQGKFWQYHDLLFINQQDENSGVLGQGQFLVLARQLELNIEDFNQCLVSRASIGAVRADTEAGKQLGLQGTPTLFINGERVVGAQSYDALVAIIEKYLR